ncbi:hypothetical protein BofuT4_uP050270.1 [Botrytis cinerea T4]|uniref:Uncharacterized protein n=1 Tax=Botryotinia fuckeliana (strain T4) TaxID=999810 RepID=G2XZX2_BOTF4|nr:hypothetical protein BofuT4_uP050270.1 [Botrytis cinerea T4]
MYLYVLLNSIVISIFALTSLLYQNIGSRTPILDSPDGDGEVMNRAYDFSSHPCDMRLMKGDKREKKAQQIH